MKKRLKMDEMESFEGFEDEDEFEEAIDDLELDEAP